MINALFWLFIIFVIITLIPGLVIKGVGQYDGTPFISYGPLYIPYALYVIGVFSATFLKLYKRYIISSGRMKSQLRHVFIGTIITTFIALITNLIFPFYGIFDFFIVGPIAVVIMVIFIAYAIAKHGLWNFRKIVTEVLVGFLIILSVFNIVVNQSYFSGTLIFFFKILITALTIWISIVLVNLFKREQKQKKRLRQMNKHLIEMDKKKTEFLHIATHQLRGPVTSINGYASLIKNGDFGSLTKEQKHVLQKIIDSGKMMTDIINDYMDIARIEENNLILHKEYFYLCELVQERAEMLRTSAEKKGLRLVMKNVSGKICKVYADKKSISQVINSLLENAIKYTIKGEVTVYTEKSDDGKRAMVHISDSGIGIPKDEIDNIFVKFSRASNAKQSSVGGTGMGLFIAKSLIELNGGTISVHSDGLNKGTTFTIELPLVNG